MVSLESGPATLTAVDGTNEVASNSPGAHFVARTSEPLGDALELIRDSLRPSLKEHHVKVPVTQLAEIQQAFDTIQTMAGLLSAADDAALDDRSAFVLSDWQRGALTGGIGVLSRVVRDGLFENMLGRGVCQDASTAAPAF